MKRTKTDTPEINDIQRERLNKARENYKRIKKSLEPFIKKQNVEQYPLGSLFPNFSFKRHFHLTSLGRSLLSLNC